MTRTFDFIPGSSILGWCAYQYLRQIGVADKEFMRLFVHGGLIFENLYISDEKREYLPSPLSLKHPKYKHNPVINSLISPCEDHYSLKHYCSIDGPSVQAIQVETSISFHHDRSYQTGITTEGAVFSYESINRGQDFSGKILGTEADLQSVVKWLNPGIIRLGKSKTAQYGEARVSTSGIEPIEKMKDPVGFVSMTLISDTIIQNELGFSTLSIPVLQNKLNIDVTSAQIASNRIEGILNIWHTRKPSENTFSAGTTFKLKRLPVNWQTMESDGIGERRHEGFGRVKFNIVTEKNYTFLNKTVIPDKQSSFTLESPPLLIQDICRSIIRNNLIMQIQILAFTLAEKIPIGKLTKSLITNLEGFAKSEDFVKHLKTLKSKSTQKMEDTKWDGNKFNEYLSGVEIELSNMIKELIAKPNVKPLVDTIRYTISEDYPKFQQEFLLTLFSILRKKLKQTEDDLWSEDE
jgi:CRISPR-associated protein Csx10